MQSIGWYMRRLSVMSPIECLWRLRAAGRDQVDRLLTPARRASSSFGTVIPYRPGTARAALIPPGAGDTSGTRANWHTRMTERASRIVDGRLDVFDQKGLFVGDPPRWNHEHSVNRPAPMGFAPSIDYRDFRVTGDARVVWEPNRHHHLVVLGRAWRLTGDGRYARAAGRHIETWIEQCPLGLGMNWRSPLELAIRVINWVWTHALLSDSGAVHPAFERRWLNSLGQHVREIARKYSRGSSANNHLIGEAAGVYIAASYLPELRGSEGLRDQARNIIQREILAQTYADGGTREQALGYHLFVMQFFLAVFQMARATGDTLRPELVDRFERMFEFIAGLREGGVLPMYGDADDGRVLDLGGPGKDADALLAIGAVLFGRADFAIPGPEVDEALYWNLGPAACAQYHTLRDGRGVPAIESRAFPRSGIYLLQWGEGAGTISVAVDCGELGLGPLAAHGHADALSIHLRAGGEEILVDPGTYDYFSRPGWRSYFRGTAAHNTVTVDDQDQSEMLGPFLWGKRASARCLRWTPGEHGGEFQGEHDGFARLRPGVMHLRSVSLDGPRGLVTICDRLHGAGRHRFTLHFHFAERCTVRAVANQTLDVEYEGGRARVEFDPRLAIEVQSGSESPPGGFVSRGYHQRAVSTSIRARGEMFGAILVETVVRMEATGTGKTINAING